MGVRKFRKWLLRRYRIAQHPARSMYPHFDCLFLDFTSVLYAAVAETALLEDADLSEYVAEVLARLDRLVALTQPSSLVYIALDGSPPRAKRQKKSGAAARPRPPEPDDFEPPPARKTKKERLANSKPTLRKPFIRVETPADARGHGPRSFPRLKGRRQFVQRKRREPFRTQSKQYHKGNPFASGKGRRPVRMFLERDGVDSELDDISAISDDDLSTPKGHGGS
jgi:hypothetical protein